MIGNTAKVVCELFLYLTKLIKSHAPTRVGAGHENLLRHQAKLSDGKDGLVIRMFKQLATDRIKHLAKQT
jgi:hypothetical protein